MKIIFIFAAILPIISADIVCEDKKAQCPDGSTCCKLPTGQWGCCPMTDAVCCTDGLHCCPKGTTCNLGAQTCDNGTTSNIAFSTSEPSTPMPPMAEESDFLNARFGIKMTGGPEIKCPDDTRCGDKSTCCEMPNGQYGCCPFKNAFCCADHIHCCPNGAVCDNESGHCVNTASGKRMHKWMKKYRATVRDPVICPDGNECPEDSTCCQLDSGEYGCCPMPNATCCSDHLHCCPQGDTCDVAHQTCNSSTTGISRHWYDKMRAYPRVRDITCPDKSICPSGATCCPISDTEYACCPLPQAVCCEDLEHCCPTGTTCNVEEESCESGAGKKFSWFSKFKSALKPKN